MSTYGVCSSCSIPTLVEGRHAASQNKQTAVSKTNTRGFLRHLVDIVLNCRLFYGEKLGSLGVPRILDSEARTERCFMRTRPVCESWARLLHWARHQQMSERSIFQGGLTNETSEVAQRSWDWRGHILPKLYSRFLG